MFLLAKTFLWFFDETKKVQQRRFSRCTQGKNFYSFHRIFYRSFRYFKSFASFSDSSNFFSSAERSFFRLFIVVLILQINLRLRGLRTKYLLIFVLSKPMPQSKIRQLQSNLMLLPHVCRIFCFNEKSVNWCQHFLKVETGVCTTVNH